jgi:hypothetical protein
MKKGFILGLFSEKCIHQVMVERIELQKPETLGKFIGG